MQPAQLSPLLHLDHVLPPDLDRVRSGQALPLPGHRPRLRTRVHFQTEQVGQYSGGADTLDSVFSTLAFWAVSLIAARGLLQGRLRVRSGRACRRRVRDGTWKRTSPAFRRLQVHERWSPSPFLGVHPLCSANRRPALLSAGRELASRGGMDSAKVAAPRECMGVAAVHWRESPLAPTAWVTRPTFARARSAGRTSAGVGRGRTTS